MAVSVIFSVLPPAKRCRNVLRYHLSACLQGSHSPAYKKLQDFLRTFQDPQNVSPGLCRSPAMLNCRRTAVTYSLTYLLTNLHLSSLSNCLAWTSLEFQNLPDSGGASAVKEPAHFEVGKSSSQVTRMHFFPQKKLDDLF